ncbi:MAG TPA: succinate dehydrogenase [Myxococcales bacterium]|jgi:succinate dehydrogenase / fumarate reductase cytochrome b subunit|nr:succinate dehydrogenase [Myxococcales bacterium]
MALPLTTDQPDRAVAPSERTIARNFLLARMGSFLAFFPLGIWTANHLWNQLAAFSGARTWEESVTAHANPATAALTFTVVMVPLVWHVGWGLFRLGKTRSSTVRNVSNLRYWLQRASAIGLLAFLGAHLWLAWIEPRFVVGRPEPFSDIAREMHHHTPTLIVYVLGILAIAYHLANGLWSFATMGWGIAVSKSAQAWFERLALLVFFVLLAIGWASIYALYRAGA